uniref:GATA-type domain-containing protein n=1 Tax=Mycena chlorophos TaxID=658473 RepID=A0ABQ0MFS9_MYCCL|nr:predicted protein [Mycena chlorophos]
MFLQEQLSFDAHIRPPVLLFPDEDEQSSGDKSNNAVFPQENGFLSPVSAQKSHASLHVDTLWQHPLPPDKHHLSPTASGTHQESHALATLQERQYPSTEYLRLSSPTHNYDNPLSPGSPISIFSLPSPQTPQSNWNSDLSIDYSDLSFNYLESNRLDNDLEPLEKIDDGLNSDQASRYMSFWKTQAPQGHENSELDTEAFLPAFGAGDMQETDFSMMGRFMGSTHYGECSHEQLADNDTGANTLTRGTDKNVNDINNNHLHNGNLNMLQTRSIQSATKLSLQDNPTLEKDYLEKSTLSWWNSLALGQLSRYNGQQVEPGGHFSRRRSTGDLQPAQTMDISNLQNGTRKLSAPERSVHQHTHSSDIRFEPLKKNMWPRGSGHSSPSTKSMTSVKMEDMLFNADESSIPMNLSVSMEIQNGPEASVVGSPPSYSSNWGTHAMEFNEDMVANNGFYGPQDISPEFLKAETNMHSLATTSAASKTNTTGKSQFSDATLQVLSEWQNAQVMANLLPDAPHYDDHGATCLNTSISSQIPGPIIAFSGDNSVIKSQPQNEMSITTNTGHTRSDYDGNIAVHLENNIGSTGTLHELSSPEKASIQAVTGSSAGHLVTGTPLGPGQTEEQVSSQIASGNSGSELPQNTEGDIRNFMPNFKKREVIRGDCPVCKNPHPRGWRFGPISGYMVCQACAQCELRTNKVRKLNAETKRVARMKAGGLR